MGEEEVKILGLSCFYHDSAAAMVVDGEIATAAQEERFTRKKHDHSFPKNAINFCLKYCGVDVKGIDLVVFYDKPLVKFDRIIETYLAFAPKGFSTFVRAIPLWIKQKLWMEDVIKEELGFAGRVLFCDHHESHAASAFFPSPFRESAILTLDGVGEWTTTAYGTGRDGEITLDYEMKFPHSLGLLYSAFTYYTGFKVNSGEYKVMGLAPYGEPKYKDLILDNLIDLKEDGSFKMNMKYFNYCTGLTMTNENFNRLFGGKPRKPETLLTQKEMDIAKSVQDVTEEIMLRMARHVKKTTGMNKLCLAGGVALNCVANGKILAEGIYEDIWIQPAAGDAGGALGAALLAWYKYLGNKRTVSERKDCQKSSFLGPEFTDEYIKRFLNDNNIPFKHIDGPELPVRVAELVEQGNVIGWFEGRMEFGPRALGSRSIIGDARNPEMQAKMNVKIKFRESFRPFAPTVLKEDVDKYFELKKESPYMLIVAPVRKERRREMTADEQKLWGIEKLNVLRSDVPAITHVDYSARIQTIDREDHPLYYDMINEFRKRTGCSLIVNTSFNVRGEPIVCRPEEAYVCFMRTDMDYLVVGNYILDKKEQKSLEKDIDWKKEFELD